MRASINTSDPNLTNLGVSWVSNLSTTGRFWSIFVAHYTQERKKYEDLVVKGSVKPLHSLQKSIAPCMYEMQSSSGRGLVTEDDVPEVFDTTPIDMSSIIGHWMSIDPWGLMFSLSGGYLGIWGKPSLFEDTSSPTSPSIFQSDAIKILIMATKGSHAYFKLLKCLYLV